MSLDTTIDEDAKWELQETLQRLVNGFRDPDLGKQAREDMDKMREETRRRIGIVEAAVNLIRDARDQ